MNFFGKAVGAVAAAAAIPLVVTGTAYADIPFGQPITGSASYYNDAGFGSCGTQINAATELLVAVPAAYWTTANPNADPLCQNVNVEVTYNGRTITVPVKDKCPSCAGTKIDLSQPAFAQLADTSVGIINVTWKFVQG